MISAWQVHGVVHGMVHGMVQGARLYKVAVAVDEEREGQRAKRGVAARNAHSATAAA